MSKTDASKKSGKKKKLRKLAAQKLAHAAANNALNDIIAAAGAERGKSSAAGRQTGDAAVRAAVSGVQQDASPLGDTYHRGPVILRGPMIPNDNTTANLLKPNQETDWLHMDPWRVLRIQSEFVDGFQGSPIRVRRRVRGARRARAGGQRVRLRPHAAHRPGL